MTSRRVHQAPHFSAITDLRDRRRIALEIKKLKPAAEVSVEGVPDLAKGKVIDWIEAKKLFTVKWDDLPDSFQSHSGSITGLRSFFKIKLLSTQVVFKCELIRRLPTDEYQYRIPTEIYQHQNRTALRVPLRRGEGKLKTPRGTFSILDLSTSGARLALSEPLSASIHHVEGCTLILGKKKIATPDFGITLTHRGEQEFGCRFHGLTEEYRIQIKHYLIEELQHFFFGAAP
jgi:hypothetical protein